KVIAIRRSPEKSRLSSIHFFLSPIPFLPPNFMFVCFPSLSVCMYYVCQLSKG
ncbi:hypothetical protein C7212DRAFT_317964, partial [Tuber magnatum]